MDMLAGKTVMITGASGALGSAVTARAAEFGASLILVDLTPPAMDGGERAITVDLTDAYAVRERLMAAGDVDCLFHLAGGFAMGAGAEDIESEDWSRMFSLNVTTLRHALAAIAPGMRARGRGSIVTVGARSALSGVAGMSGYCAAKSAVMRLTESLSAEMKADGVNVNCVLPSLIDTPANRADMPDADPSLWVSPADLANVICFLGSDLASAVHGALIPVSGLS